jgi:hypothetical protein
LGPADAGGMLFRLRVVNARCGSEASAGRRVNAAAAGDRTWKVKSEK